MKVLPLHCKRLDLGVARMTTKNGGPVSSWGRKNSVPNRPFPSSPGPLFQKEGRCSAFGMEIIFHSHTNKTHFHKQGCAPRLILKVRVFGTRKWPVLVLSCEIH